MIKMGHTVKSGAVYLGTLAIILPHYFAAPSINGSVEKSNASYMTTAIDGDFLGEERQNTTTPTTFQKPWKESQLPKFQGGPNIYFGMTEWTSLVCGFSVCDYTLARRECLRPDCDTCHCDEDCRRYGDCCPDYYLSPPPEPPETDLLPQPPPVDFPTQPPPVDFPPQPPSVDFPPQPPPVDFPSQPPSVDFPTQPPPVDFPPQPPSVDFPPQPPPVDFPPQPPPVDFPPQPPPVDFPLQPPKANFSCISQVYIGSHFVDFTSYKMVASCPLTEDDNMSVTRDRCLHPNQTRIQENIPVYSARSKLQYRNAACARCNGIDDTTAWNVKPVCEKFMDFSRLTSYADLFKLIRQEETCAIHFHPPVFSETRECLFTANTVKTCNVSGKWRNYHPDIERACSLYSQPFLYVDDVYENIFCAACNGIQLNTDFGCLPSDVIGSVPFSFILDIRQATSLRRKIEDVLINCTGSEVYDSFVKTCRPLVCPQWRYPQDSRCVSPFPTPEGMGYILHFSLTPRQQPFLSVVNLRQLARGLSEQINCKVDLLQSKLTVSSVNVTYATSIKSLEKRVQEIDVQYSLVVGATIPRERAESHLVGLARSGFWWHEDGSNSLMLFDFKWQPGVNSARLFNMAVKYRNGALKSRIFTVTQTSGPVANNFKMDASSYIRVNDLLMCNMIELNSTEYTAVNSSHIFINFTGELLGEGQHAWNGNNVRVCTKFTGDIPDSQIQARTTAYDETEVILTLICTCLSLCGLAVTIVIYLVIPSVRQHLPGKNNMFLFSNLFLAQLFFLTGSSAKVPTPGCRALGIIIHYFWLATFCWKVVCAYHMYRLFTTPLKMLDQTKSLCRYILFCHLFPALWIIGVVSINLGLSDLVKIGYADRPNLCFLSSILDLALAFIIPVGLVIIFNTFFFSRSIYALRHRPKLPQTANSNVKESVVYFKMSLLFGFTWILGLVALLVNERGMWYVFTAVNASIGVFVFVSFGLKNLSPSSLMRGSLELHTHTTSIALQTSTDIRESASVSAKSTLP